MDISTCICVGEKAFYDKPALGLLKPIFWVRPGEGYERVNPEDFPNNGCIYVTRGYDDVTNSPEGTLFEINFDYSESSHQWDPAQGSSSKYSTWKIDKNWKKVPTRNIKLCTVIDGEYPDLKDDNNNSINIDYYPTSSFFLRCFNEKGSRVLIGPLDATVNELPNETNLGKPFYQITYSPPNRPFKYPWDKLSDPGNTNCVFEFDVDTLPEGWSSTASNEIEYVITDLLITGSKALLDLSTNAQILKWFQKVARQSSDSGHQLMVTKLKEVAEHFSSNQTSSNITEEIFSQRVERLSELPSQVDTNEDFTDVLNVFSETDFGKSQIKKVVEADLQRYIKLVKSDETERYQSEVQAQKEALENSFDKMRLEKEKQIKELDDAIARNQHEVQRDTIAELESKIKQLTKTYGFLEDVSKLEDRAKYLEQNMRI